jgi:hypothetical protein
MASASLEDIRGLKPFIVTGPNPWAIALLAVIALVLGLAFFYLARSRPTPAPKVAPPSPVVPLTLRGRLDALAQGPLLANGEAAKFCDQLSDILRDFLLQRYGLGSRRLTSSELLEELGARGIPVGVLSHVEAIVTSCDLVKFAKVRLGAHELTEALTATYVVLDLADLGEGAA